MSYSECLQTGGQQGLWLRLEHTGCSHDSLLFRRKWRDWIILYTLRILTWLRNSLLTLFIPNIFFHRCTQNDVARTPTVGTLLSHNNFIRGSFWDQKIIQREKLAALHEDLVANVERSWTSMFLSRVPTNRLVKVTGSSHHHGISGLSQGWIVPCRWVEWECEAVNSKKEYRSEPLGGGACCGHF